MVFPVTFVGYSLEPTDIIPFMSIPLQLTFNMELETLPADDL